jgi:hypothetical protein
VQHKKRGRPRLRDEREPRHEAISPAFGRPPDLRRPLPAYAQGGVLTPPDPSSRASPYKVLKSQNVPPPLPRHLEYANPADANVYSSQAPRASDGQELPWAYLTLDLQICDASRTFNDFVGLSSVVGTKLPDIVSSEHRAVVYRLQSFFESDRKAREPNYLPPIYGRGDEERVIKSIGGGPDSNRHIQERPEFLEFRDRTGQTRRYSTRLSLAKKDSVYFIILILDWPTTTTAPPHAYQTSAASYSATDTGSQYRAPQSLYPVTAPPPPPSYSQYQSQYTETHTSNTYLPYRQPPPTIRGGPGLTTGMSPYLQPSTQPSVQQSLRPDFPPGQPQRQSAAPPIAQTYSPSPYENRLPPIQSQMVPTPPVSRPEERSGRVDIGGLLQNPTSQPRNP